ncbi:MAG: class II aldolase/adducin family protein [Halanaerobiaceae bacterium]|nr:class II aldolase/adducin family protein [Halanaerobiaceae bacterium]
MGKKMLNSALTIGTWGNISLLLDNKEFFGITPSGMDYNQLTPEDIVIMDLAGNIVDGKKKPSIESPLHYTIYRERKDIKAVVHTHSIYASAMAAARKPIPAAVEDLAQIVGGSVRVAEYYLPGTEELGKAVVDALQDRYGALLANHGVVGIGRSLQEAMTVCEIIEKGARITIAAQGVGGVVELEQEDIDFMRNFFLNSYGQDN